MHTNRALLAMALKLTLTQPKVSLEAGDFAAAEDAKTEVELEHTWYGQLTDPTELEKATTIEGQEQWSIPAQPGDNCKYGGSVRVRKSVRGDETSYMMCIKAFEQGKLGCLENEFEINEATFEQVKRVAESGMIKTRYTFPIEGTDYAFEVDVYPDGKSWVKVDLEVEDPKFKIPELPVTLKGLIKDNPARRTPEQDKLIKELMLRYFKRGNAYQIEQ